jgi:hypothetical protein
MEVLSCHILCWDGFIFQLISLACNYAWNMIIMVLFKSPPGTTLDPRGRICQPVGASCWTFPCRDDVNAFMHLEMAYCTRL